jgi:hypothetical protein
MKVVVMEDRIEIYREGRYEIDSPGRSCREFAQFMMAWAMGRLAESTQASIEAPGSKKHDSVLCD